MVYGVRPGATLLLNPQVQPPAQAVFDPITRRAVRYVETIVPTVAPGHGSGSTSGRGVPADRFYCDFGALSSPTTEGAEWAGTIGLGGGGSGGNWDTTIKRRYVILSASGDQICNGSYLFYPTGFAGEASTFAPKNASVTSLWLKFQAKFPTNADYTTGGIGLSLLATGAGAVFSLAGSSHFIQVLRNAGSWELGSCDGTTVSQTSGGTGDGNWHEFWVKWTASDMTLYVDGTSTITKSTNMPTQTLRFAALSDTAGGNDIWLSDVLIYWE